MYYKKSIQETCEELNTNQKTGLSMEEAKKRLMEKGPNELVEKKMKTKLEMFGPTEGYPYLYPLWGCSHIHSLE